MSLSVFRALAALGCLLAVPAWALVPAPCDTVSFGATLIKNNGWWGDLSGEAGCRKGDLVGHVDYVDHEFKFHMRSTAITGYFYDPAVPNARDICGIGVTDGGGSARFRVRVQDNGHGKNSADMAGLVIDSTKPPGLIVVTTRLLVNGAHGGGNVELHTNGGPPSGTGFFSPDESHACGGLPPP